MSSNEAIWLFSFWVIIPLSVIYTCCIIFYSYKFSEETGEPMWFFLYYSLVPLPVPPKDKPYQFPKTVLEKNLESKVLFIHVLQIDLGGGLFIIWIIAIVILNLIFR